MLGLKSYLSNGKQFTFVNGMNSQALPTTCSVPHGSVLWPSFISDILTVNCFTALWILLRQPG